MSTTLEFELGPADLDAFWVHHATYAPYIVARNRRMRWIWFALFAFLTLAFLLAQSPAGAAAPLVFAIVYLFFYDRMNRWWYVRHNRRINSGPDGPRFGVMRLELADGRLLLENAEGSSKHALSAIRRIDESDSHFFIYLGPVAALVVPNAGDPARAFMQDLRAARAGD